MTQLSQKRGTYLSHDIDVRGKGRQFKSDFLEKFSSCHGLVPLFMYTPIAIGALVLSVVDAGVALGTALGLAAAGIFFWTFFEYWMHREFFHWQKFPKMHYFLHGIHHVYPNDKGRQVMPPGASLVVAIPMYFICVGLFGYGLGLAFYGGFVGGYVWYDTTHFWTHVGKARSRWGKYLKQHHMRHHFESHERRFGVSTPLWDKVFGTMPRTEAAAAPKA
ncbi:MAG: sterol desaturase family protein [Deltaproteobacteria bacterium]|nr:sterol desaturase family protein [Deltaproteobacteria bacterium]